MFQGRWPDSRTGMRFTERHRVRVTASAEKYSNGTASSFLRGIAESVKDTYKTPPRELGRKFRHDATVTDSGWNTK